MEAIAENDMDADRVFLLRRPKNTERHFQQNESTILENYPTLKFCYDHLGQTLQKISTRLTL